MRLKGLALVLPLAILAPSSVCACAYEEGPRFDAGGFFVTLVALVTFSFAVLGIARLVADHPADWRSAEARLFSRTAAILLLLAAAYPVLTFRPDATFFEAAIVASSLGIALFVLTALLFSIYRLERLIKFGREKREPAQPVSGRAVLAVLFALPLFVVYTARGFVPPILRAEILGLIYGLPLFAVLTMKILRRINARICPEDRHGLCAMVFGILFVFLLLHRKEPFAAFAEFVSVTAAALYPPLTLLVFSAALRPFSRSALKPSGQITTDAHAQGRAQ